VTDPRTPTWARKRAERDAAVLDAACAVALEHGLSSLTRRAVAIRSGKGAGTVNLAFGTMAELRDAVIREAVARPILPVLAQALAMGEPIARAAPETLRAQALEAVS